jgi:hypothetical protein
VVTISFAICIRRTALGAELRYPRELERRDEKIEDPEDVG